MNVFLYKTPDLNTQGLFTAWSLSSHTPLVSLIETTSGHGLIIRRFGVRVPVGPQSKPLVIQRVTRGFSFGAQSIVFYPMGQIGTLWDIEWAQSGHSLKADWIYQLDRKQ